MKKLIWLITAALIFVSCSGVTDKPVLQMNSPIPVTNTREAKPETTEISQYKPLNYDTVKAVWISYLELAPILDSGEEHFASEFDKMCRECVNIGFNTLFVHVRAFSDSFYPSEYYPYSKAFCGNEFDALSIIVKTAHRYDLSLHAWINPLRCETEEALKDMPADCAVNKWLSDPQKYDEYVVYVESTKHYWLNPAVPEIRQLIADGAGEIVRKYEVDGVHIDDYFYPTDQPFFDSGIYVENDIGIPLSEWRMNNCSEMVRLIYSSVKQANSSVLFGIAPQGNIENNYNYMFADVKRWISEKGFCDYIVPQIYFGYENKYKPFAETFSVWTELPRDKSIKLMIGIGAYKISSEEEFIEREGIIADQIGLSLSKSDGMALFSFRSLFESERADTERELVADRLNEK
ncbi:MAG: family 10 glycosylhydrolase [Ruminococcus sp.]|nr:family 10 glycosylhydrolase [Ruminococcus sp.]